ncbi:MAG: HAMP domain-containing protein [Clostridia bacterium]|nr:HAMP domain-containing protein [Clostridia bacterium]
MGRVRRTKSTHEKSRSPRRRLGAGGRINISGKLFAYFTLFTAFILLVVWVMQIGLLNSFYRQSKEKELDIADGLITECIVNDPTTLESTVEQCAIDFRLCARVFILENQIAHQLASVRASRGCLIHYMSDMYLNRLYEKANESGGTYTLRLSPEALYRSQPEALIPGAEELFSGEEVEGTENEHSMSLVRVRVIVGDHGESYIILLNSEIAPLNATVDTLQAQFWTITAITLVCAMILAILISRNISKPLRRMNVAARRMAMGRYDVDFRVGGYREVVELSDSLTNAANQLSRTDRLQKELIANISHDLRTPLTMIIGYSEVMRDLPGENTPENIQVIIDETQRLAQLVNDLLDLSKLQAGSRMPVMESFNLTELIEATILRYEKLTRKDGYRIEFSADVSVDVSADRTMLLQVIYNLINNAINYAGDDKLVRVTQQLSEDGSRVRVSVMDNGVGIAPDQIPMIWDRYYKIDKVHRRAMIGTGLGLSIVKQILEAHRTTYGVESKLGKGSTFWFDMRVEAIVTDELLEDTSGTGGQEFEAWDAEYVLPGDDDEAGPDEMDAEALESIPEDRYAKKTEADRKK